MKKLLRICTFCMFCLLAVFLVTLFNSAAYAQKGGSAATYVGADACKQCHEAQVKSYQNSIHGKKAIPNSPAAKESCEACHGPGSKHVEQGGGELASIITFSKKESGKKKSANCLVCHEDSKEMVHWDSSKHKTMGVSCDACHSSHSTVKYGLKAPQSTLCLSCHNDVRNQLNKQARHPIQEGKVKCSDCHSAHGTTGKKAIKADSTPDLCYKCHTEKRGPYAFEHAPVAEDCGICHQPHGSNHTNLLNQKSPQLCQNCHDTSAARHAQRTYTAQSGFVGTATGNKNKFFSQGCLNCHGNIHGSNRSPALER